MRVQYWCCCICIRMYTCSFTCIVLSVSLNQLERGVDHGWAIQGMHLFHFLSWNIFLIWNGWSQPFLSRNNPPWMNRNAWHDCYYECCYMILECVDCWTTLSRLVTQMPILSVWIHQPAMMGSSRCIDWLNLGRIHGRNWFNVGNQIAMEHYEHCWKVPSEALYFWHDTMFVGQPEP